MKSLTHHYFGLSKITLLLLLLVFMCSLFTFAAEYASEQECDSICADGDYTSTVSCYKGFRDTADSYLATANCALNNGDNDAAEKYAVKSATYRGAWITFLANKVPGVTIRTGGTASSYALAYVASEKQKHKDNTIKYARTSGQCQGADDLDLCAEAYFNNSVASFRDKTTITVRNTNPHLAQAACNWKTQYQTWIKGECACRKGFEHFEGECTLPIYKLTKLDINSALAIEDAFVAMQRTETKVIEITYDGKKKKIAIAKTNTGAPKYSVDGKKWEDDLKKMLDPSWKDSLGDTWNGFTTAINPLNWFDTKYKDDREGQNKQVQYEIAKGLRAEFIADGKDTKILEEQLWDRYQKAQGDQQSEQQLILDLMEKGLIDTAKDMTIDKVKGEMWTYFVNFPGEAVNKFAQEASDTDFFQAVYYYNQARADGQSATTIRSHVPEEMLATVSVATVESFSENAYWAKLEEGYGRYEAWKELEEKK